MLPIKKIYIDSRWKTANSKSETDFTIQLPQNYHMPKNTVFFIDHVCIPVSWYSVQKLRNNKFYFLIGSSTLQVIEIPENNYKADTLVAELVKAINSVLVGSVTGTYDVDLNTITISLVNAGVYLIIPSDVELLKTHGKSMPLDSINSVLRNYKTDASYSKTNAFRCDYLDLFPVRNLYIHSNSIGNHNTISVSGECNIIKQVTVNASYNQLIVDNQVLGSDYLDCSNQNLNLIDITLRDAFSNIIDLNGNHWSFNIIFSKVAEEN
jgi:hypothetical protein